MTDIVLPRLHWSPQSWLRPLGETGLQVSAVTFGASPLGGLPEADPVAGHERGVDVVRQVLASPLRTIDTANGYRASERLIGEAIADSGGLADDAVVITKVDPLDGDFSGERVRRSVAESKQRLGLDELPLVMLHDPESYDFAAMTGPGGAVEALRELRSSGVVGHIGLAAGDTRVMRRYLDLGCFEVVLVHNRWTLVDHSAAELIEEARRNDVAVMNAAVYGGGILADPTGSTSYGYRPASAQTLQAIEQMADACRDFDTDLRTAALQWSVRDQRVATTVVGFTRGERIGSLLEALTDELPDELWQRLCELLPESSNWLDH